MIPWLIFFSVMLALLWGFLAWLRRMERLGGGE